MSYVETSQERTPSVGHMVLARAYLRSKRRKFREIGERYVHLVLSKDPENSEARGLVDRLEK